MKQMDYEVIQLIYGDSGFRALQIRYMFNKFHKNFQ